MHNKLRKSRRLQFTQKKKRVTEDDISSFLKYVKKNKKVIH